MSLLGTASRRRRQIGGLGAELRWDPGLSQRPRFLAAMIGRPQLRTASFHRTLAGVLTLGVELRWGAIRHHEESVCTRAPRALDKHVATDAPVGQDRGLIAGREESD